MDILMVIRISKLLLLYIISNNSNPSIETHGLETRKLRLLLPSIPVLRESDNSNGPHNSLLRLGDRQARALFLLHLLLPGFRVRGRRITGEGAYGAIYTPSDTYWVDLCGWA